MIGKCVGSQRKGSDGRVLGYTSDIKQRSFADEQGREESLFINDRAWYILDFFKLLGFYIDWQVSREKL